MSGRTRNMAADAAHLAGLGAGPSGSASGHRAHRRLCAEQGGAASGALDGRAPGLGAAQVLVEARHDLDEIAGTVAVVELVHVTKSSSRTVAESACSTLRRSASTCRRRRSP